jgi:hypothetical protein
MQKEQPVITFDFLKEHYQSLLKDYNTLVKEHNTLVNRHNELTEDAQAIMQYLNDLRIGIAVYVNKGLMLGADKYSLKRLVPPPGVILDEGRLFCTDFHNEITHFLEQITNDKKIIRPKDAYNAWIKHCEQAGQDEIDNNKIIN